MPETKHILYRILRVCAVTAFLLSLLLLYREREINGVLAKELAGQKRATESVTQAKDECMDALEAAHIELPRKVIQWQSGPLKVKAF